MSARIAVDSVHDVAAHWSVMITDPVLEETISLRASAFEGIPVKASIDRGCSLTKILFLPKDAKITSAEYLPMRCLTFQNTDFEAALRVMKEQADLPTSGKLHVTGVGCDAHAEKIKEILELDILFVNEFITIGRGAYLLIRNAPHEEVFHKPPEKTETMHIEWDVLDKIKKRAMEQTATQEDDDGVFPACFLYVGSGAAMMSVSSKGETKLAGGTALSGRPFLGLAKVLLGTNNYNEIMDLASRGNPANLDLLAKDIIKDDPNSHIGRFPPDLPVFPFGKASEASWNDSNSSREDKALSLVALFVSEMLSVMFSKVMDSKMKRAYFGGNFFRSEIVRNIFHSRVQMFQGIPFEVHFLKTGHTGAIATMLTKEEDLANALNMF